MQFQYLSAALHPTAADVVQHFKDNLGLSKFEAEQPIHKEIGFKPTLHAFSKSHHIICVEVSEQIYPPSLDAFVLKCKNVSLPVLLYVAVPSGLPQAEFKSALKQAKENGVGLLEVADGTVQTLATPLSLSLTGVRPIPFSDFPSKYRHGLSLAQQTFLDGDPAKGCANVYDEIEQLTRRLGKKLSAKGMWADPTKVPKTNFDSGPWAKVVEVIKDHVDLKKAGCPLMTDGLLYRVLGITPHRNETGHKPSSMQALRKRDSELRTRFEHASDILLDLVRATSPLRL